MRHGHRPAVLAHRGFGEPENSLAAFTRALEAGADGVEIDVRSTVDGILVLAHDAALSGGELIGETEAADVGDLVRLEDALEACRDAWIDVEVKHDPATDPRRLTAHRTVEILLDKSPDHVLVTSSDRRSVAVAAAAGLPVGLLTDAGESQESAVARARALGCQAVLPRFTEVNAASAPSDMWLIPWTVNDPQQLEAFRGLTAVITDRPDVALSVYEP